MGRIGLAGLLLAGATIAPAAALERAGPPAPEVARPCPAYGPGFVRLPGTATCARLSGRAAAGADLAVGRGGAAGVPTAAGRFAIDTRSESEFGPVRTYVRVGRGRY